jgi:hypothetical protein
MSDRLQQIININAPLLEQRTQIIRQRVGNAALSGVPTLYCPQRDVEIAGKGGLPARPVEGFANSGELVAGQLNFAVKIAETKITGVHQEKIASFLARSALLVFPDVKRAFFGGVLVSLAASGVNKIRDRFSGLRHVFRLTYPRNFVAVKAAVPDAGCVAKVFVCHLGLLTVLSRPNAVPCGHNIATSSVDCKRI